MNKMSFVIWMLLFPVATSTAEAIVIIARAKANIPVRSYSEKTYGFAALVEAVIWGVVGYFLFTA